ncbi:DUF1347 family protein [Chlamydia pecorum]|uniref:Uncharacterized protein n=1 Tax=Chlamydia pecorum (strain ATCC VR-628 / DSM 29919 / E58) TaxID=331635 RepID=A0AA34WHP7_CHLPE|nr:DUF1347 family protein [Chlamydia pecorum]AEB41298.1 conserved hypothetical protein [Chlamydia pecorum E58]UFP06869.1 DUF1347 family protein [Chlamydia pecorum]UJT76677.1 hypothetical protein NSWBovSBE_0262 [Chlamydia pecorum]
MFRYFLFCAFFLACFFSGSGLYYLCCSSRCSSSSGIWKSQALSRDQYEEISAFCQNLPSSQQHLYVQCSQGFSLQKQLKFDLAEKAFSRVADEIEDNALFKEEVMCGKIINAFFLNALDEMEARLSLFEKSEPRSIYLPLVQALYAYQKKDYSKVPELLSCWKENQAENSSFWLNTNFQVLFADFFFDHLEAHSLIETGRFCEGREILNQIVKALLKREHEWNTKAYDYTMLLLSRSYFLELISLESESVYPDYYDMISFYLKKIHILELCPYAQLLPEQEFISTVVEHLFILPKQRRASSMQILELWQHHYSQPQNQIVVEALLGNINTNLEDAVWFCEELASSSGLNCLRQALVGSLGAVLSEKVKSTQNLEAKQSLKLLQVLEPNISISKKLSLSLAALQDILLQDDKYHTKLRDYLGLWEEIQSYDIGRQQLVHHLVEGAKELWEGGGKDEKALNLLRIVLEFTNYDIECKNIVFLFVKQAYKQAMAFHAIPRLLKLGIFIKETGISPISIREEDLANFLEDAEYLFSHGEYQKSYLYCSWLSEVAPSPQVYRLLGFCLMEEQRYQEAWNCFLELPPQEKLRNLKVQKAMALCQKHLSKDLSLSYKYSRE